MDRTGFLLGCITPVLMVGVGWTALRTGFLTESGFIVAAVMPAAVVLLAWVAFLANEVVSRRRDQRQRKL